LVLAVRCYALPVTGRPRVGRHVHQVPGQPTNRNDRDAAQAQALTDYDLPTAIDETTLDLMAGYATVDEKPGVEYADASQLITAAGSNTYEMPSIGQPLLYDQKRDQAAEDYALPIIAAGAPRYSVVVDAGDAAYESVDEAMGEFDPTICWYVSGAGQHCQLPPVPNQARCENHSCPFPGCESQKSSKVAACPEHLNASSA